MPRARAAFAFVLATFGLWSAAPAWGQEERPEPRDQVVLSGDVVVRRGEDVGQVVVLHGTATIGGVVHGDVVVLDGPIAVTGQVSGSVVAVNGPVQIGPNAQVRGDVLGREEPVVADGARIDGDVRRVSLTLRGPIEAVGAFAAWLAVAISTLLLGAVIVLLAPRSVDATTAAATGSPWQTLGMGVATAVGLPLVALVAIVSLVGLPFGLGLLLALALVYAVGFAVAELALGRAIWGQPRSRWLALLIGWAIVTAVATIPFVGGIVWFAGAIFGLGAIVVATWRARGHGGRHRAGGKMADVEEPSSAERASGEEVRA